MAKAIVTGDKELIAKLQSIKKTKAKAAIRKGSRAGSKVIMAQAKANAPVQTGQLAAGFKVRALPRSRRWTGTQVTNAVRYSPFVELGTKHEEAKKFIRNAVETAGPAALEEFINGIKDVLNES